MPGFVLTNKAKADLKAIGRYSAERWGREQRNAYLTLLDGAFHKLAANRALGQDCSHIRPDYRKWKVGRHVVFYRAFSSAVGGEGIEIVRILHERMNVERRL